MLFTACKKGNPSSASLPPGELSKTTSADPVWFIQSARPFIISPDVKPLLPSWSISKFILLNVG